MVSTRCSQLKPGDKILENVLTSRGSVLFYKGRVLVPRDLDILQAFCIEAVTISDGLEQSKDKDAGTKEQGQDKPHATEPVNSLETEYHNMIELLRQVYNNFADGRSMPIMDIRSQLERLLGYIDSYKVLQFMPNPLVEKDYLLHNSVCSALTCYMIAKWTGLEKREWMQVSLAGLLHDVGNIRINKAILGKPAALTAEEQEEVQRHPVYGYQLLKNMVALNEGVKLSALQHHEKLDGSGYPLGIDASQIHPYSKIVAVADIFHAMRLNKAYRKGSSPYLILEQLVSDSFGKLDAGIVRVFVAQATQFHNGTVVKLNDGRVGEIVFSDSSHPTRPWVSINGTIVHLNKERQLHIQELIQ